MIRLLGICFMLILVVVAPTIALDYYFESSFLDTFMAKQSLLLMGTMLSIYIVTAASFLAILSNYEKKKQEQFFGAAVTELKKMFYLLLAYLFCICFSYLARQTQENVTIY